MRRALCMLALLALMALLPSAAAHGAERYDTPPLAMLDPSPLCQGCQMVLRRGYEMSQNETEMEWFGERLHDLCATMKPEHRWLCDLVADVAVKALPSLPETLYKGGFYTPQILCSVLSLCSVPCCEESGNRPSQVHLSVAGTLGDATGSMAVTWVTADEQADRTVRWGMRPDMLDRSVEASTRTYTEGGWLGAVHSGLMSNLPTSGETVFYQVGGDRSGWSPVRAFAAPARELRGPYTFLVTGDMGAERNYSGTNQDWINYASGSKDRSVAIDAVIHVGDISYADGYMERWDQQFTILEPTASIRPYMTVPGNHEFLWNFTAYRNRFAMPVEASGAAPGSLFYSFDVGCVHFVGLNSESEINTPYVSDEQVAWLKADLERFTARREAGRQSGRYGPAECSYDAPRFLVAYLHRPLYCSQDTSQGRKRCGEQASYLRDRVEPLLVQHGADLSFSGHVHAYERSRRAVGGRADERGHVHIMNGAGGNREGFADSWLDPSPDWSVNRSGEPGLGYLRVLNGTAMQWQFFHQVELGRAMREGRDPNPFDQAMIWTRG